MRQRQIAEGKVKPDLFQFFINDTWKIQHASVITGCAKNGLAFTAHGDRSEQALARGPAVINQFLEALVLSDVSSILNEADASAQVERLNHLTDLLFKQSWNMVKIIPTPSEAEVTIMRPVSQEIRGKIIVPLLLELGAAPAVTANITTKDCKVMVTLSAGPNSLLEAKTTGQRWARIGGVDGHIDGVFLRRNTDRFVGQERVDGTGIDALVDDSVLVRVIIPGNKPCVDDPKIVQTLFDQIISHDLSVFKRPM
ncbi:hypothetical protein [Profundibacter sp.]